MAPRKNADKKTKSPKASIEKNKKGLIQKKKPGTAKASQIGKKSRPSRGFKRLDPIQTENTSMAIVLASSVPTQPQASKKASASTSGKGTPPPKAGSSLAHAHEERFRSPEHVQHYYSDVKHRSIIPDRNIMLEEGECAEIQNEISRRGWDFFCRIAGQGRQKLTHEFYTNGWKVKGEEWPQFTSFVRGKEVHFHAEHINKILCFPDAPVPSLRSFESFCTRRPNFNEIIQTLCCPGAAWLPLNQPKPKALKMGDLLPIPQAWGAFIIASILLVLHDTTLLLDRAKLLFAIIKRMDIDVRVVISKEMENIMLTKKKSLAYSSLITLLCLDAGVNLTDDDVPISDAKAVSARRISEYELAFKKKQPNIPSTSRPPPPRHPTQVRILDNRVMIQSNQAVLALRQDVLYEGLRKGQLLLAKNLIEIPERVHTEGPSFLCSADLDDDLLGEHLGHKALPPFPAAGQSYRDKDNDDNEPTTS
ncbi:hypothetical protein SESBI_29088 [Sesbania bispinosa]|nr:hypothetical protein SESBI_29088 [Sesbania bispinosa]